MLGPRRLTTPPLERGLELAGEIDDLLLALALSQKFSRVDDLLYLFGQVRRLDLGARRHA